MQNCTAIKEGFHYFLQGWQLISKKGLKRFVVIPILLNILLLSILFWFFITSIQHQIDAFMLLIPIWLQWLSSILMIFTTLLILLCYYFIFNTLSGFIIAPFNGVLAEEVEILLSGEKISDDGLLDVVKDIPRTIHREWQKLCYSVPRLLILFLLSFIPLIGQSFVPILFFIFTSWMMAIQYCDYPFDNHKIPFTTMKYALRQHSVLNITFGTLVTFCSFIPFINFVIIPVAVCGATAIWVDKYRINLKEIKTNTLTRKTRETTFTK